jgi:hypothetical protein
MPHTRQAIYGDAYDCVAAVNMDKSQFDDIENILFGHVIENICCFMSLRVIGGQFDGL